MSDNVPLDIPPHPFDENSTIGHMPMPMRLEFFLTEAQGEDWWSTQALETFAYYRHNPQTWGHICEVAKGRYISSKRLEAAVTAHENSTNPLPTSTLTPLNDHPVTTSHAYAAVASATEPWRQDLQCTGKGEPKETLGNIGLILHNHPTWAGNLWWDTLHGRGMYRDQVITEEFVTDCAQWLCVAMRMPVRSPRLVERTLRNECKKTLRDTLQEYLAALPPWDGNSRLDFWLADATQSGQTAYCAAISRIIPLSMIARALDPGCLYRYVVIFEGDEEIGKSSLVRVLAGEQGYVELSMALESKEAHMILRGAWVAELAELDSLSRTEETRLKSFITMREDTYIPKYANDPISIPRRAIFIGTTNEESYLKGQTGNSRFLPLRLEHSIDIEMVQQCREQLLAEALIVYAQSPATWWRLPDEALEAAKDIRSDRRIVNEYEGPLQQWLDRHTCQEITWPEIAKDFLEIPTAERWKDKGLQMQIGSALRALGWRRVLTRRYADNRPTRVWRSPSALND